MTRLSILMLLATLSPCLAEDLRTPNLMPTVSAPPGGVARLVLAHQLYAVGIARKDPLTVLNAARLAGSVALTDTPRAHETTADPATTTAVTPATPTQMLAAATGLAVANEALLDLIDTSRREAPFTPLTNVVSTKSSLAAAGTDTWALPFFGAALAEVAILGNGNSNLDLSVADENGTAVCQDSGPSDTAFCSFYPARNATFQITIRNAGVGANSYLLLTN